MKHLKTLLIIFLSINTNYCFAKKNIYFTESRLVIAVEERDFSSDRVTQYNVFSNGLFQKIVTHDSGSPDNLFKSRLKQLDSKSIEQSQSYESKLAELDFENSFPWKEGLYTRGNLYKISFVGTKKLEYISRKDPKDSSEIKLEKILYYYEGHKDSPQVFKDVVSFIKGL
jgi:hypothetical protein